MPNDDISITEEEVPQVTADEVLQYMNDNTAQQEQSSEPSTTTPEEQNSTQPEQSGDDNQTTYYFSSDATFSGNQLDDVDKELFTDVDKTKVEVTREDKIMYLKAVLNDTPVHLDIPLAGSRLMVSCRALTTQEKIMVPIGCLAYCDKHRSYPVAAVGTLIQMARVAMQVTAVDGRPVEYIELHEPLKNLEKEKERFTTLVLDKVQNMNSARYNYLIQALNVFEHKLARLSDAALDQDFWDPVATD